MARAGGAYYIPSARAARFGGEAARDAVDQLGGSMTRRVLTPGAVAAAMISLSLAACTNPYDPGQRAVAGGLIGAGSGAALGAIAAGGTGAAVGAAVGGSIGAVAGAFTTPQEVPPPPR